MSTVQGKAHHRHALAAYRGAARADRVHVWVRMHSCPFDEVAARVPTSGRVLDVGCGHGLFSLLLALTGERDVTGTDVDTDKLVVAAAAAGRAAIPIAFAPAQGGALPPGPWDAITIVDVLYLIGHDAAHALLRDAAAHLAPGGTLVVKEVQHRPRWKYLLTVGQELLATRIFRITEGEKVAFLRPDDIGATLARAGLDVHHERLDRGRLHPHHLVIGRRAP